MTASVRKSFVLNDDDLARLARLKHMTRAKTDTQPVMLGLVVTDEIVNHIKDGGEVIHTAHDGTVSRYDIGAGWVPYGKKTSIAPAP